MSATQTYALQMRREAPMKEKDMTEQEEFDIVELVASKNKAKDDAVIQQLKAAKKSSSKPSKASKKTLSIADIIAGIRHNVISELGMHKQEIQVITDENDLESFINRAISNGVLAYDTETDNSLDYLTCKVIGLCLYTPGLKAAYVPLHHVDFEGKELPNQISDFFAAKQLQKAVDLGVKFITHNGKFDYQVTKCFLKVAITLYWDSMVACRMIDENDESASLKWQYRDKIDKSAGS